MTTTLQRVTETLPVPVRARPRVTTGRLVGVAVLVGLFVVPPLFGTFASFVATRIAVVAIVGLSVTVVTGYCGQLSLMSYTFAGIGLFVTANAMTFWGWPFWLAVVLGAAATVPLAVPVGLVAVRLRGFYFAIATLTFAAAAGATLFSWDRFTGGQRGLTVAKPVLGPVDLRSDEAFYVVTLATALLLTWMVLGIQHSRVGRAMSAVRENEIEAQALGVNVMKTKLVALVVSGLLAGVGGGFQAMLLAQPTPTPYRTPYVEALGVLLVIVVVVGGIRSAWGPVIGATVIYLQQEYFRDLLVVQYFVAALAAALFLFVLLRAPGGLVEIAKHDAALVRENPRKHGPRVALTVLVQVAVLVALWAVGRQ